MGAPPVPLFETMYAVEATVRQLARNIVSGLELDEIEAVAVDVDAEIDGMLGNAFYWPTSVAGVDLSAGTIPPAIVSIANYITAGLLEQQNFAQNEAGSAVSNPYGKTLERTGRNMLARIVEGRDTIRELERFTPVAVNPPPTNSYKPVSGFGSRGSSRRRN